MSRYKVEFIPSALRQFKKFPRVFEHRYSLLSTVSPKIPGRMAAKSFTENSKNFIELIPEIIASFMKFTTKY